MSASPDLSTAIILGLIEGVTEFIPVSSTAHMLLADHFFGFSNQNGVFEIVIQLGAILAIVVLYFTRLWRVAATLPSRRESRYFVLSILVAFLPAAVIGVLLHGFIKRVLFASPGVMGVSLLLGGVVILLVERYPKQERLTDSEALPLRTAIGIGFLQCLAMIPGVSRSGATIVGGMMLGVSRRAAAEFSFFLSIPTMAAAAAYDLWENFAALNAQDLQQIGIGFVVAFLSAILVVRGFMALIARHGLAPFAWYRIIAGCGVLAALALGY